MESMDVCKLVRIPIRRKRKFKLAGLWMRATTSAAKIVNHKNS